MRWEIWEELRPEAVEAAKREIGRRRWRGARGGVLPEGHDTQGVASEAIRQVLNGETLLKAGVQSESR